MFKALKRWRQRVYLTKMWSLAHYLMDCPKAEVSMEELDYILARYSEDGRFYHGLNHLEQGFLFLEAFAKRFGLERRAFAMLIFSYFYHDVIMHFGRKDNERLSADQLRAYFNEEIDCASHEEIRRMDGLIMATADHQNVVMTDPLWPIMNDTDLLIFYSPPHIYDQYAENVWKEYSAICDRSTFEAGRRQFLVNFRAKPIFRTGEILDTAAPQIAITNITRELATL